MVMRLIGVLISLAIIGYMFYSLNRTDTAVNDALNNNPTVQEQKKTLQSAGVNTSSPEGIADDTAKKALAIKAYQDQVNNIPSE
jgi:hypothetical protein